MKSELTREAGEALKECNAFFIQHEITKKSWAKVVQPILGTFYFDGDFEYQELVDRALGRILLCV